MKLTGYTDFDNDYANRIGMMSIVSIVAMIIVAALCALFLLQNNVLTGNIYLIAILVLMLELICNIPPMIKAHGMDQIPQRDQEYVSQRARMYNGLSTVISIAVIVAVSYLLV